MVKLAKFRCRKTSARFENNQDFFFFFFFFFLEMSRLRIYIDNKFAFGLKCWRFQCATRLVFLFLNIAGG